MIFLKPRNGGSNIIFDWIRVGQANFYMFSDLLQYEYHLSAAWPLRVWIYTTPARTSFMGHLYNIVQ